MTTDSKPTVTVRVTYLTTILAIVLNDSCLHDNAMPSVNAIEPASRFIDPVLDDVRVNSAGYDVRVNSAGYRDQLDVLRT